MVDNIFQNVGLNLPNQKKIKKFIEQLYGHIKSIDYEIRNLKFVEKCNNEDFNNIIMLLNSCIEE